MRNFGLLKSIVENALVKTYKTEDFKQIIKEFRDFIKDNKSVGELYVEYGSLMKTKGLNEEVAKEFLGLSVDFIKNTINSNKREFEQFDSWVETLGESIDNQYVMRSTLSCLPDQHKKNLYKSLKINEFCRGFLFNIKT